MGLVSVNESAAYRIKILEPSNCCIARALITLKLKIFGVAQKGMIGRGGLLTPARTGDSRRTFMTRSGGNHSRHICQRKSISALYL